MKVKSQNCSSSVIPARRTWLIFELLEPEPEPEVTPDPVMRDEIAELLATPVPVVKKSKPKQVRQAKKPEAKTITEDDIAAALGLGDDSDD